MQEIMKSINTPDELFHGGNPATGELGTIVSAQWLNDVQCSMQSSQAEIISVLTKAGIDAAPGNNEQLFAAMQELTKRALDARLSGLKTYSPGQLVAMFSTVPPAGTLACNGGAVSRTLYDSLFREIGTKYGAGDGATTFNLPNIPDGFALLGGGSVGATTVGSVISHAHSAWTDTQGEHTHQYERAAIRNGRAGGQYDSSSWHYSEWPWSGNAGAHAHNVGIGATGGSYNYAAGMKLLVCIAY